MSYRAQKSKRKTQSRSSATSLRPAPLSSSTSNPLDSSSFSQFAETASTTTIHETPTFIAGPDATTFQPPISLAQLAIDASTTPAPPWPINNLLPEGLCLLAAKPHAGSRTLALQLALSVACGTPALDYFPTNSGEVLYLGFHDTRLSILARSQQLLDDASLPTQLSWANIWQNWQQDGLDTLSSWLDAHPHTRLLVIDSFSDLLPPGTTTRYAYSLLHQFSQLAHTHHLCILLLHSLSRISARDPFSSIPCSPVLLEICETLAVLDHDRGTPQATLHLTGHTLSTRALALSLSTQDNRWNVDPSSIHPSLFSETTPEIPSFIELLARYTPRSLRDLASDEHPFAASVTPTPSNDSSGGYTPVPTTGNTPGNAP